MFRPAPQDRSGPRRALATLLALTVAVGALLAAPAAAGTRVAITSPPDGTTVSVPEVTVAGTAPAAAEAGTVVVYTVDVSGSTYAPFDQDCNGDGVSGAHEENGRPRDPTTTTTATSARATRWTARSAACWR